jgi:hypothetical protein
MNPRAALLIIVAAVIVLGLLVWLAIWWIGRQAGVRRAEYKRMTQAIAQIDAKADLYRDIDSVLAADVRQIIRNLNTDRMDRYQ